MSISKDWDYDKDTIRINQVTVDSDEQDKYGGDSISFGMQFQSFRSINDVNAFILELWKVAKETWPDE